MKRLTKFVLSLFQASKPKETLNPVELPQALIYLKSLQDNDILTGEEFEFWIDYQEDHRYSICPIDAIPFASTGNNGIHFAFLTDFGLNKNLSEAPIICIAPSYDPPVNLVASNLHDFLSIVTTIENSTLLADVYKTKSDFEKRKDEWFGGFRSEAKWAKLREELANRIRKDLHLTEIDHVIDYTNRQREKREKDLDVNSKDGLGIKKLNSEQIEEFSYSKNPMDVKMFLKSTNRNSRLLFFRNSYYEYILTAGYDTKIKDIIIDFLVKDGYTREARNLRLY